jgi:hypothetical protein
MLFILNWLQSVELCRQAPATFSCFLSPSHQHRQRTRDATSEGRQHKNRRNPVDSATTAASNTEDDPLFKFVGPIQTDYIDSRPSPSLHVKRE